MTDYFANATVMTLASLALGTAVFKATRRTSRRSLWCGATLAAVFLLSYLLLLRDSPLLTRLVPCTDVLAYGEWLPPILAVFLGLRLRLVDLPVWRKALLVILPAAVAVYVSYLPLFTSEPRIVDRKAGECVLQSGPNTCGAAAAATFLSRLGLPTTESEMAKLCLTRWHGTPLHGIVRGLRIRMRDSNRRVVAEQADWNALRDGGIEPPLLLIVGLTEDTARRDPRYHEKWGWTVGQKHVVVFLGRDRGEILMDDPSNGTEHWTEQDVRNLWTGVVIRADSQP